MPILTSTLYRLALAEYACYPSSTSRAVPCVSTAVQRSGDVRRVRSAGRLEGNLSLGRTEPPSQTRVLASDVAATLWTRPHLVHL